MILKCNCKHKYQDEKYGKDYRVFNLTKKRQGDRKIYRCTVCSKEI